MPKKVLILAGGGGHTGYAEIIADRLHNKVDLIFITPENEAINRKRLEKYGHVEEIIKPRHPKTNIILFPFRLFWAFCQSIIKIQPNIDLIISTGSNFCIAPSIIGYLKGIPIVNLESRVKLLQPSKTAKILQKFSSITILQWPEQSKFLKGIVVGPLLPNKKIQPYDGGYILASGGTYGYEELFDALVETDIHNIILQTGKINPEKYREIKPDWKIFDFSVYFLELIAGASIVISPPGTTPVESVTYGKYTIIVRYPDWTKAADIEETRMFAQKINAFLLEDVSKEGIQNALAKVKQMEKKQLVDGTTNLVNLLIEKFRLEE